MAKTLEKIWILIEEKACCTVEGVYEELVVYDDDRERHYIAFTDESYETLKAIRKALITRIPRAQIAEFSRTFSLH